MGATMGATINNKSTTTEPARFENSKLIQRIIIDNQRNFTYRFEALTSQAVRTKENRLLFHRGPSQR